MVVINSRILGADIGLHSISICRFDNSGNLEADITFNLPHPAMPGAVTIAICVNLISVDPDFRAGLLGVSISAKIDANGRTLKSFKQLPGWINVPLADWLEPRICRRVNLIWVQNQI